VDAENSRINGPVQRNVLIPEEALSDVPVRKGPIIRERLDFLKVPLDIVQPEDMAGIISELLAAGEGRNIVLLSLWDLLRARRNGEYRAYILSAALVLPISKSLVGGARFLTGKKLIRYMPFDFIVDVLSILEGRELSLYMLGGKLQTLRIVERNLRQTFPRLRIVGRHDRLVRKQEEAVLVEAIRKAAPSLLLVGKGINGEEQWIARHDAKLARGLRLWCSDIYDVFAERRRHPSRYVFEHGLEWIGYSLQIPLRLFRIFPYMYYKFLLLVYRLFKSEKRAKK
jgi:N-acetylglucosaminyldiphosphoundecaprenol N-acetyl-beta-D-mannosaminyltransferase